MIQIKNIYYTNLTRAIYSSRNAMNSWEKSDSDLTKDILGPNDSDLACRLIKAGPEHRKFLRMIHVSMDIIAPLYFFKEIDTYKIGTVANSCSTMHRVHTKEFTLNDFSHEHLGYDGRKHLEETINLLNFYREKFIDPDINEWNELIGKKEIWWQMIQLLPSSYNQLRTLDCNYEVILTILKQRKGHKLDEWHEFRRIMFEELPYIKEFYTAMTNDTDFN